MKMITLNIYNLLLLKPRCLIKKILLVTMTIVNEQINQLIYQSFNKR